MDEEVTALKATLLAQQWLLEQLKQKKEQTAVGHYLDEAAPSVTWETDHLAVLFPCGELYEFFKDHMFYLYAQGTARNRTNGFMFARIDTENRIRLLFNAGKNSCSIVLVRVNANVWSLDTGKSVAYLARSRGLAVQQALQAACAAWELSH